mmetsp:Transcript_32175/g.59914  ORF Transcript_32175/g.59914 Transcript_32175/m.59914 type:complete len:89 (-) Transcript_32175:124-390(-)
MSALPRQCRRMKRKPNIGVKGYLGEETTVQYSTGILLHDDMRYARTSTTEQYVGLARYTPGAALLLHACMQHTRMLACPSRCKNDEMR